MAQVRATLRVDMTGVKPLFDCMESLAEALSTAQFDGQIALETSSDGLLFEDHLIARLVHSKIVRWTVFMRAVPTFCMPLFAADVCERVPGVKVTWCAGWPRFSASDGDDAFDLDPNPTAPETLPVPA